MRGLCKTRAESRRGTRDEAKASAAQVLATLLDESKYEGLDRRMCVSTLTVSAESPSIWMLYRSLAWPGMRAGGCASRHRGVR